MAPDIGGEDLLEFLLLAAFLILLLPPLVATITGVVCGFTMPRGIAMWGGAIGLGLGVVGVIINVAGLFFLLIYLNFDPWEWALSNFCPEHREWWTLDRDSFCIRALKWSGEVFWVGISLITPIAAGAGTWWLCRRRSTNQR